MGQCSNCRARHTASRRPSQQSRPQALCESRPHFLIEDVMKAHDAAPVDGTTGHGYINGNAATLPRLAGNRCRCAACLEFFNSASAFDLHRTGAHGGDRRCREPCEMLAIGMSRNAAGFWIERRRGEAREKRGPRVQETRSGQIRGHGAGNRQHRPQRLDCPHCARPARRLQR